MLVHWMHVATTGQVAQEHEFWGGTGLALETTRKSHGVDSLPLCPLPQQWRLVPWILPPRLQALTENHRESENHFLECEGHQAAANDTLMEHFDCIRGRTCQRLFVCGEFRGFWCRRLWFGEVFEVHGLEGEAKTERRCGSFQDGLIFPSSWHNVSLVGRARVPARTVAMIDASTRVSFGASFSHLPFSRTTSTQSKTSPFSFAESTSRHSNPDKV